MDETSPQIQQLIERFYHGNTTEEEEVKLHKLLKQNPSWRTLFIEYEQGFKAEDKATNQAWDRLEKRLTGRTFGNVAKGIPQKLYPLLRYAAVFVVAILSYHIWIQFRSKPVHYCELIVPKGQKSQLLLPDGTKVWINSESKLRYPTTFSEDTRSVELDGEGYFKVTHDTQHPFTVKTKDYTVKVHGTEFNLSTYSDLGRTETILIKGSVEVEDAMSGKNIMLRPGEKLSFNTASQTYALSNNEEENVAAWTDNQFCFTNIPFKELCARLSRWYDVTVVVHDPSLEDIRYRGNFKNKETIWQVLDIVKLTTPIEYTLKDRVLTIYKRRNPMK